MHTDTFKIEGHEYRVHHDGDWTGGAEIVRPDGTSFRLPAALLRAIGARLFCSRALAAVEAALEGIDRDVSREPSPTITYPEQKPPPGHTVQFVASPPARCAVCDWPLKATIEEGCTVGSCSYRPEKGGRP